MTLRCRWKDKRGMGLPWCTNSLIDFSEIDGKASRQRQGLVAQAFAGSNPAHYKPRKPDSVQIGTSKGLLEVSELIHDLESHPLVHLVRLMDIGLLSVQRRLIHSFLLEKA